MRIKVTPGLVLGTFAVVIALVGTAFAASGQLVHITDPAFSSRQARVDDAGELSTRATPVSESSPTRQFQSHKFLGDGSTTTVIPATSARFALSRVGIRNYADSSASYNASVNLWQQGANGGSCTGPARDLGAYSVKAGETVLDALPVAMVLKPPSGYRQWCLRASANVIDNQGAYYAPGLFVHGYVVSGTLAGAESAGGEADLSAIAPKRTK